MKSVKLEGKKGNRRKEHLHLKRVDDVKHLQVKSRIHPSRFGHSQLAAIM